MDYIFDWNIYVSGSTYVDDDSFDKAILEFVHDYMKTVNNCPNVSSIGRRMDYDE
jgi:hypothetical protein